MGGGAAAVPVADQVDLVALAPGGPAVWAAVWAAWGAAVAV